MTRSTDHIFMSYSRKDEEIMRRVVRFLRFRGHKIWVDNEGLVPGTPIWEAEIERAIRSARAVIVILSPDSRESEWVRREISYADQYKKRIFPVMARGDETISSTLRLITRQYVDIRNNESLGLNSLSVALSDYLSDLKEEQEPSEPIQKANPGNTKKYIRISLISSIGVALLLALFNSGYYAFTNYIPTNIVKLTYTAAAISTNTAIAKSTGTAIAIATTNARNKYVSTIEAGKQLVFGPENGSLEHEVDDYVEIISSTIELKNFIVKATFTNPYATAEGAWDYGVGFRDDGSNQEYRLVITSDKRWSLYNYTTGTEKTRLVREGKLEKLDTSNNGSNTIWLYCLDDRGILYLNGEYVGDLDLSARQNTGTVWIGTGFINGHEINGNTTGYEDFNVWEIR